MVFPSGKKMGHFQRRQFLLASAALIVAAPARAGKSRQPYRVAFVPDFGKARAPLQKVFVDAMRRLGRLEGRDYVLYHSGVLYGQNTQKAVDRALGSKPDLIVVNNLGYAVEVQQRTQTIPIVMWLSGFPVEAGVARSLAKPGKNVTGMTLYAGGAGFGKLLELLHEAKPSAKRVGFFMSYVPPFHPRVETDLIIRGAREAAGPLGIDLRVFEIAKPEQVDKALASARRERVEALLLTSDASIWPRRKKIMQFAVANHLPTIVDSRWIGVEPQPLLGYSPDIFRMLGDAADYANRILWGGAKPGDLPIQLPAKFDLVVNLKSAHAIGIAIPKPVLLQADKVIE